MQATREFRRGYQPLGLIVALLAAIVIAGAAGFLIRGGQQASPAPATVSDVSTETGSGRPAQGPDAVEREAILRAQSIENVGVTGEDRRPDPTHGAVP